MAGYHIHQISKGVYGELSKIQEELDELRDAEAQGIKILALVELSDLYGAVDQYLKQHHPGVTMDDLRDMAAVTHRAFQQGVRVASERQEGNERRFDQL